MIFRITLDKKATISKTIFCIVFFAFFSVNTMEPEKASMPVGGSKSNLVQLTEKKDQPVPFAQTYLSKLPKEILGQLFFWIAVVNNRLDIIFIPSISIDDEPSQEEKNNEAKEFEGNGKQIIYNFDSIAKYIKILLAMDPECANSKMATRYAINLLNAKIKANEIKRIASFLMFTKTGRKIAKFYNLAKRNNVEKLIRDFLKVNNTTFDQMHAGHIEEIYSNNRDCFIDPALNCDNKALIYTNLAEAIHTRDISAFSQDLFDNQALSTFRYLISQDTVESAIALFNTDFPNIFTDFLTDFLKEKQNKICKSVFFQCLLSDACCNGNLDLVKLLSDQMDDNYKFNFFNFSQKNLWRFEKMEATTEHVPLHPTPRTPLMHAVFYPDILEYLLQNNADANLIDTRSNSPLMIAAAKNQLESVKVLLKYHANVNSQNNEGYNALMFAVLVGNIDMVELLIKAGTNLELQNVDDENACQIAQKAFDSAPINKLWKHFDFIE